MATQHTPHLTEEQAATLDAAERILVSVLHEGRESLMFSLHCGWEGLSVTYFSPSEVQHSGLFTGTAPCSLSDKIQMAISIRAAEEGRADEIKAERIQKLKAELAAMTGEPA